MFGSGGFSDGYGIGSKRPRMMESNPYFAVSSSASGYQQAYDYDERRLPPSAFPVVRLRGLPFDCAEIDIYKFFAGLDIVDVFLVNKDGRFSGDAFVVFAGDMQVDYALRKNRQNMGRRYVEVFSCRKQDYYEAIAAEVKGGSHDFNHRASPPPRPKRSSQNKDQMEYTEILKLRGLPYRCKKSEIVEFFGEEFHLADDKVHIGYRPDGKATGDAFVEFMSTDEAKKAMCKDNGLIGSRYIELFPSHPDEARRAKSRARQ